MFYWLVGFVALLGIIAYVQSLRAERKAYERKMEVIRKKIEANDRKKLVKELERTNTKSDKDREDAK